MNDTSPREYTIWNTPLSVLLRGRLGPARPGLRRDPLAPVSESSLPGSAKLLITTVVRKTRLWKHEKQEIAEELLAHFSDGLEAGRSIANLTTTFGDPRRAARLMRRAKIRNRPLWWKLMRGTRRVIASVLLVYAALLAWMFFTHPSPTTDYVARLNEVARSAPQDQCAWPIYRPAFTKTANVRIPMQAQGDLLAPGHPDWPAAKKLLEEHQDLITAIHQGSSKPYLGLVVGNWLDYPPEDRAALGMAEPEPGAKASEDPRTRNMMVTVLLPSLSVFRKAGQVMSLDLRDAASTGDSHRVAADYQAIRGLARQVREQPMVVSYLVAIGLDAMADAQIRWAQANYPQSTSPVLVELLHAMAPNAPPPSYTIQTERDNVLDLLQRIYTNSGHGDGHLTVDGLRLLQQMTPIAGSARGHNGRTELLTLAPLTPVAATIMVSRREATQITDHYFSLVEQDLRRPAWEQLRSPGAATAYRNSLTSSMGGGMAYAPVIIFTGDLSRFGQQAVKTQATHDALMTALALEVYRSHAGHYPQTLAELIPQYLPKVPLDLSSGEPLLYKLKDGKPLLYGRGLDETDDGGIWIPEKNHRWPDVPSRGDWILYPEPVELDSTAP